MTKSSWVVSVVGFLVGIGIGTACLWVLDHTRAVPDQTDRPPEWTWAARTYPDTEVRIVSNDTTTYWVGSVSVNAQGNYLMGVGRIDRKYVSTVRRIP
jgi:hypothetical protein